MESRSNIPKTLPLNVAGVIAVGAMAILVYLPTLWYGFTFDDWWYIVDNEQVHEASGLWRGFVEPFPPDRPDLAQYRPLLAATFTANYLIAEPTGQRKAGVGAEIVTAWPFHLTNVVMHAGAALLVVLIAQALVPPDDPKQRGGKQRWGLPFVPLAAGALFALHPVHIEAVANAVGRGEVQMALFYLAAVYALLQVFYLNRVSIKMGIPLCIGFFFLAIFTKESAITFPLFAVGFFVWLWRWNYQGTPRAPSDFLEKASEKKEGQSDKVRPKNLDLKKGHPKAEPNRVPAGATDSSPGRQAWGLMRVFSKEPAKGDTLLFIGTIRCLGCLGVATLFYLVCRLWATQGLGLEESVRHFVKNSEISTGPAMAHVPLLYTELLLFPIQLIADYQFPISLLGGFVSVSVPETWGLMSIFGIIFFASVCIISLIGVWKGSNWGFALLLLLAPLAVYTNLIPFGHWAAERFLYLSSAGVCLLLALGLVRITNPKVRWIILSCVLVFYGARTLTAIDIWSDQESFFRHQVAVAPENPNNHYGLAQELFQSANIYKQNYHELAQRGKRAEGQKMREAALARAEESIKHHLIALELNSNNAASRRVLLDLAFFVDPPRPELVREQYEWYRRAGIEAGEYGPRYWLPMADIERNRGNLQKAFRLATAAMRGYHPQRPQIQTMGQQVRELIIREAQVRQQQRSSAIQRD